MFIIDGTFGGGGFTGINTGDSEVSYFATWNGSNVTSPGGFSPARGFVTTGSRLPSCPRRAAAIR